MDDYSYSSPIIGNILIVDDEPMIRNLLAITIEKSDYSYDVAINGKDALRKLSDQQFDVVVTDIDMPEMNGIELSKIIKAEYSSDIIVMTGQIQSYQYDNIIGIGASDFVTKPFSPKEIILRVDRVMRERGLKQIAQKAHEDLKESYIDSIHRLVMAAEYKDEDTGDHIIRIGKYCSMMAEKLNLSDEFLETISHASPMHDIGKMGIPDKILLKPGKLSNIEFETIKTHTLIGARLLSKSKSKILKMAQEIALNHHEKFNGKGYPNQIAADKIPLSGRIVAIADTFDALTSKRPYKDPYPPDITYDILKKERGEHFDPDILDIFINNFDQFIEVRGKIGVFEGVSIQDFVFSERDKISLNKKT